METAHAPTFAIVTPTYAPDFEHCRLLVESVQRYVPQHVKHYLIIDRKDEQLFSELHSPRTKILLKQEILPWWIHQLPFAPKWWISMRSLPIRGWIVQQLVKLSVNLALREDIYVFLDSGAMFVRPYDPATSVVDGMVPLFREQKDEVRLTWNTHWHQVAARLLGLPVLRTYDTNYVGNNPIYWRRENLTKLQRHIEKITGKDWIVALCRLQRLSEYVIYGVFVEHILKNTSGQYETSKARTLSYWQDRPMNEIELCAFKEKLGPEDVLVTFNEHAKISPNIIRRVFAEAVAD